MAKPPPTTPLPAVRPLPMALVAARVVAELQAKPTDVVVRRIEAKRARFSEWPDGVDSKLIEALRKRGIERPYATCPGS